MRFEAEGGANIADVQNALFNMDPNAFRQTMKDMHMDEEPAWSKMDFLERYRVGGVQQLDPSNPQQLLAEIERLKHEKRDLAAELQKVQNLLTLQTDIERDRTKASEEEIAHLRLQVRSANARQEDMARLADVRQREVHDLSRKLATTSGRPGIGASIDASALDAAETQSEFSVVSQETDMMPDENVLDLAIDSADFSTQALESSVDRRKVTLAPRAFFTFVAVDFFNHDTKPSEIADGFTPIYATQFSFKNKVDNFYLQHLMRNYVKVEVFVSTAQQAVHIGVARILLRGLVEQDTGTSAKPPIMKSTAEIVSPTND